MIRLNRRNFLKLTGIAGGAVLLGLKGEEIMAAKKTAVALKKTNNRKEGVQGSLKALGINPVKGKNVLIKPNFNTADITPGSTHNDTLDGPGGRNLGHGGQVDQPGRKELSAHSGGDGAKRGPPSPGKIKCENY